MGSAPVTAANASPPKSLGWQVYISNPYGLTAYNAPLGHPVMHLACGQKVTVDAVIGKLIYGAYLIQRTPPLVIPMYGTTFIQKGVGRPNCSAPLSTPSKWTVWDRLAQCESGGNWAANTGNGFYGGVQFSLGSWQAVGGTGLPSQATRLWQITKAKLLWYRQGWGAWPVCSQTTGVYHYGPND